MSASAVLALVRPFTLLMPAVGVASGAVVAHAAAAGPWRWGGVACGLASALLATAASNAWNQVFDVEIDRVNKPGRPIPAGALPAWAALLLGQVCALAALVLGWLASPGFFFCVALGIVATWIYSAPPLRTKRHPVGALVTIAVARGLLVPVAGWAILATTADPQPWVLGAVAGLFVLGAAATKDFADVEGDRAHGCRTLPIVLGPRRAAAVVAPFLVLPFLLYPIAADVFGWLPSPPSWWVFGVALALAGLWTAARLRRDPGALAGPGGSHPAWVAMYLVLLCAHVGSAVIYRIAA